MNIITFLFGTLVGMLIGLALRKRKVNKDNAYKIGLLDGFDLGKKYASLNLDNDDTDK